MRRNASLALVGGFAAGFGTLALLTGATIFLAVFAVVLVAILPLLISGASWRRPGT